MKESTTVSKLSKFSAKMTIPREYILAPELYDYENGLRIGENWKSKFDQWQAAISS